MAREKRLVSPVTFRRIFLLVLAVGISYLFYLVVEPFLVSVLLAAIFAGMAYPFFEWLRKKLGGSHRAGLVTLLTIVLLGIIPAIAFVGVLANEALSVSESVTRRGADSDPELRPQAAAGAPDVESPTQRSRASRAR